MNEQKSGELDPSQAMRQCKHFDNCQKNKCPLAVNYDSLKNLPQDELLFNYEPCKFRRRGRHKVGLKYNLKNQGLTLRELSAQKMRALNLSFSKEGTNMHQEPDNSLSTQENSQKVPKIEDLERAAGQEIGKESKT